MGASITLLTRLSLACCLSGPETAETTGALSSSYLPSRLEAIDSFLKRGGKHRCDLPRVNVRGLSWAEVHQRLHGRPALLQGLLDDKLSEGKPGWSKEDFVAEFGSQRVKTNNGHFDHLRAKEVLTLSEYLSANTSEWNLFFADMAYELQKDVLAALIAKGIMPRMLDGFDARPILSVGSKGSSTRTHRHAETWQLLIAGVKAWWLSGGDLEKELLSRPRPGEPCDALANAEATRPKSANMAMKSPWLCIQHPGEVVYFGNMTPHATCNLESFVLGLGAQGATVAWPPLQRAAHRGDAAELRRLVEEIGDVDGMDSEGFSALHRAASMGHLASVTFLVGAGANLRQKDTEGKTAAVMATERGNMPLLRFLVDAGAVVTRKNGGKPHAVHWAALSGHRAVLELLIAQGASAQAKEAKGTEPIHWASMESDAITVAFLVEELGANVSASGLQGERPLHWAAGVGHASIVNYLLNKRADANAADVRGTTALHFASAQDRLEVARRLIAARADLAAPSAGGMQPLHAGASMGHSRIVKVLLAGRASALMRDSHQRQPIQLASEGGHSDVVIQLERAAKKVEL